MHQHASFPLLGQQYRGNPGGIFAKKRKRRQPQRLFPAHKDDLAIAVAVVIFLCSDLVDGRVLRDGQGRPVLKTCSGVQAHSPLVILLPQG